MILSNPRYTGRQVWNKQRKDEVLIDVENVALGHETRMRWNKPEDWVWSTDQVHEPLSDTETFEQAQQILAARNTSGWMFCASCSAPSSPSSARSPRSSA